MAVFALVLASSVICRQRHKQNTILATTVELCCCRPFDNTKIVDLTAALASSMTSIDASDINTISAVQTVSLLLSA